MPAAGYDRHFAITGKPRHRDDHLAMREDGPDVDPTRNSSPPTRPSRACARARVHQPDRYHLFLGDGAAIGPLAALDLVPLACRGRCRVTDGTAARADHGQEHSAAIVFLIMIDLS